jgi:N-acetylglucosaminyldiphosphoundecaprenol N-acetyl-beta-D-mannosaminyltransferase
MPEIFGFRISNSCLNEFYYSKKIINTINPHSYYIAKKDIIFKQALLTADVLLPDGIGIVFAVKLLTGESIKKIAGSDIHRHLLDYANSNQLKVFYLGASPNTLDKIDNKLKKEYPNIKAGFFSPPFKPEFSVSDTEEMIHLINSFSPNILFVGMTAPKQEKWVYLSKDKLQVNTICCIGAVFDFYAETVKRPPNWIIKIGLEWLGRFIKEPSRMWRRIFISSPVFILDVLKEFIRRRINFVK